jgi:predicted GTPase
MFSLPAKTTLLVISDKDNESDNVVFLKPTGCGKSNLVNQLYNKKVVISKPSACSVTKNIHYTQGQYKEEMFNIVDTIGMCDSTMNKKGGADLHKTHRCAD